MITRRCVLSTQVGRGFQGCAVLSGESARLIPVQMEGARPARAAREGPTRLATGNTLVLEQAVAGFKRPLSYVHTSCR